jgi:hypothetical protein
MISPATIIKLDQSEEYVDESSQESTEHSNFYEAIEHPMNDKTSKAYSDCGDQDSLYLNISKRRRDHLKLHRNIGWDMDDSGDDHLLGDHEGYSRLTKILRQVHKMSYLQQL